MVKIYCLIHPVTNYVFYVGSTSDSLGQRLLKHIHNKKSNKRLIGLIFTIKNVGKKPDIMLGDYIPIYP
jgi:hypothetical protein